MRKPVTDKFPELESLSASLMKLFQDNVQASQTAKNLVIAEDQTPILSELTGSKLVIVPGSHLMPSDIVPKTSLVVDATKPRAVIFSGGRTTPSILEGQSEASLLRDAFHYAHRGHSVGVWVEDKSMHTRANFENIASNFGGEVEKARHIVLVAHHEHSNRAKMAARQAFCYAAKIMAEDEFNDKVVVALYKSDRPEHDIDRLDQIALVVAKMILLRECDKAGIRHIKPTDAENIILDRIYTCAQEYALTA